MAKIDLLAAIASPGSRPLKNAKYEHFCRLRASAQPRIAAYREAGWQTSNDDDAYSNAAGVPQNRPVYEDEPGRRSAAKLLTKDEARRIGQHREAARNLTQIRSPDDCRATQTRLFGSQFLINAHVIA